MPIDTKKLKNAPEWIDEIGKYGNLSESAKILDELKDTNEAYSDKEIEDMLDSEVLVSLNLLDELVDADILGERGGMYYIEDKSRAKKLIQLCDL